MSNYPVLWENVMLGIPSEIARKAFVWAAEGRDRTRMKYPAEEYAHEVETLRKFYYHLSPTLKTAHQEFDCTDEVIDDLFRFILKRHAIWRWGDNVKMWWEAGV